MLNINYNVRDRNGVRAIHPNQDEVTEGLALSAMYNLFWSLKRVDSLIPEIEKELIPFINEGSLFPFPIVSGCNSFGNDKYSMQFDIKVDQIVYQTITNIAYSILPVTIFYSMPKFQRQYRETFDKVASVQISGMKDLYKAIKHPAIEKTLERTMFALHDQLLKLQAEVPQFIAAGNDKRLLVGTQSEIDYYEQYYSTLRDEDALRLCKLFAGDGWEVTYDSYRVNNSFHEPELLNQYSENLKIEIAQLQEIAIRGLKAQSQPINKGLITDDEYDKLKTFLWETVPEYLFADLPTRFDNVVETIPRVPNIDWDQRIQGYLESIAKMIDIYYCYFLTFDASSIHGFTKPVNWFEFEDKFVANWRKPIKMIKSLVEYCDYKKPVFSRKNSIVDAYFEYVWDPELCNGGENRAFDVIEKEIRNDGDDIGGTVFVNMQTMFSPWNFVEEFAMPLAIKTQEELGEEQVPSLTRYWDLNTGEFTRTTFMDNERAKPGHSYAKDKKVFQSGSTQPLLTRKKTKIFESKEEREVAQELEETHKYLDNLEKLKKEYPDIHLEVQQENNAKLAKLKAEHATGFGNQAKPKNKPAKPAKPKLKK